MYVCMFEHMSISYVHVYRDLRQLLYWPQLFLPDLISGLRQLASVILIPLQCNPMHVHGSPMLLKLQPFTLAVF